MGPDPAVQTPARPASIARVSETTIARLCRDEYADAIVDQVKAQIIAALDLAPSDDYVALPGGYRAMKVSRKHDGTYCGEVRIQGPGFSYRNDIAVGVVWAAERIAVAYLDANASGEGSAG